MRTVGVFTLGISGVAAVIAIATLGSMQAIAIDGVRQTPAVDAQGTLRVPPDYQTTYESLGSWAIAAEGRGSKELHVVLASPGSIEAYRKDGRFPDGTVLVKEVYETATKEMTTGTVSHAEKLKGWFVMVKDSAGRYPGNALWGDGWGWSWFDAADPTKTTSTDYRLNCKSCHVPARATDWIYVDGYPALKR
ncbi:cytochrome P460 family protein [Bradyrhizobium sp. CB1650]|uniref:cytochrome P460 family protein n=1 Tax=Bradyrhizobium sp. CB1650 TaxID=3039153 RepID=UPI002434F40F|nr:cytochrome P460 family protein [Bradyrhizobium sp. CB1650]WGD50344.1 cytochrome P460 family protein [Bradyrhizobium sp. CB1650]